MSGTLRSYIIDHFQNALENHHIEVYYQPVIRTISRKLCSFEALARWIDPDRGMIFPDQFIPVLEEEQLIHVLDQKVIELVCQRIRHSIDIGEIPVPVSVNLSRLDFILCDIFEAVDKTADRYQIPHDFLYIEITESLMAEHTDNIQEIVDRFRSTGYQVWMDDFGSAYSSLNILKDLTFDELKLDMQFLSSFTQRSRRILTAVVQMAKEIGIKTLAEGVETREQFRYLRNIGCEKVQGYYFGKPAPYETAMIRLREQEITVEEPQERKYYDDIGKINLLSAVPFMTQKERDSLTTARQLNSIPLAIAEGRADSFSILFYNTAFEAVAMSTGIVGNIFTQEMLRKPQPYALLPVRLINLMDSTRSGKEGRMQFVSNEEYYEIQAKCIAQTKDAYSVLFRMSNLSRAGRSSETASLDEGLRSVYSIYERVTVLDLEKDTIKPLYVEAREDLLSARSDIRSLIAEFVGAYVFPGDREGFSAFFDLSSLESRIQETGTRFITRNFRLYSSHGQYRWKQMTILQIKKDTYLELIRDIHELILAFREEHSMDPANETEPEPLFSPSHLWMNLANSGILRLFWKDRERRFLGASKGFLDYYGFTSVDEILGKTDEDLGWHIRPDHYRSDEELVIREGRTTINVPGRCICNGENREILASKTPFHDGNGEIRGLLGYFIDRELLTINDVRGAEPKRRDQLTGLLNSRGIAEEALAFRDEYFLRNADFVRIDVAIDDFSSFNRQYGFDFGDKAIAALGRALKKAFGLTSAVGRSTGHQFVILHQVKNDEELSSMRSRIRSIATSIREIDGVPVTFFLSVGYSLFSETQDLDEQIKKAGVRLLADHSMHARLENRISKASDIFHLYDDLPISYSVYKVLTDENGKVYDTEVFYINHVFEQRDGRTASELIGQSTRKNFPALPEDWYEKARRAALEGETFVEKMYYPPTDKWYMMTVSQVIHAGYCCCTYQELDII